MKIYFARSITGAKFGTVFYERILGVIEEYGSVLTRQGAQARRDLTQSSAVFDKPSIYEADVELLHQADVLIAEVSAPSHGVGREICYAQFVRQIPVLALYLPEAEISAKIEGNPHLVLEEYTSLEDCEEIIRDFFEKVKRETVVVVEQNV